MNKNIIFVAKNTENNMGEIWHQKGWPYLNWNNKEISFLLGEVRNRQGRLTGKTCLLGIDLKKEALIKAIKNEVVNTANLEDFLLDENAVKNAIINQLKSKKSVETNSKIDTFVQISMDAMINFKTPLSEDRIYNWQKKIQQIYGGLSDNIKYRSDIFELSINPHSNNLLKNTTNIVDETKRLINWININHPIDPVIKAGVVILRLLLIHPFNNGNGLLARTIASTLLSRADGTPERLYCLSEEFYKQKNIYERFTRNLPNRNLDITEWLSWFLYCLNKALVSAEISLTHILEKSKFWEKYRLMRLNDRQVKMINLLWDGLQVKLTSSFWAKENFCSPDTALRDIQDLIDKKILRKKNAGGRSTSYELC